jgi:LysR family transcriptional regulator, hydrogen peroxide-inducible genes activator
MELHQARYFLAVCNDLNFTRAAKRCNVSQPSLTRARYNCSSKSSAAIYSAERGPASS